MTIKTTKRIQSLTVYKNKYIVYFKNTMFLTYTFFFFRLWFMVFSASFNNISVISWWSVLLVKETGENH